MTDTSISTDNGDFLLPITHVTQKLQRFHRSNQSKRKQGVGLTAADSHKCFLGSKVACSLTPEVGKWFIMCSGRSLNPILELNSIMTWLLSLVFLHYTKCIMTSRKIGSRSKVRVKNWSVATSLCKWDFSRAFNKTYWSLNLSHMLQFLKCYGFCGNTNLFQFNLVYLPLFWWLQLTLWSKKTSDCKSNRIGFVTQSRNLNDIHI